MNLELLEQLNDSERDLFGSCVRTLLGHCFLVRSIRQDEKLYNFADRNFEALDAYFSFAGMALHRDELLGIITWSTVASDRVNLNLFETLSLLVFRILLDEKRDEISLSSESIVRQMEFQERFTALSKRSFNKTQLSGVLRKFQSMKLIRCQGDYDDPESIIILYPTIGYLAGTAEIEQAIERIKELSGVEEC